MIVISDGVSAASDGLVMCCVCVVVSEVVYTTGDGIVVLYHVV